MQQTSTSTAHVPGYHRNAAKHSCCILRVSKHRCMTILPVCSQSGTQDWPPEQDDAGSRGPTQLSVRPDSIAAASVASLLQLAGFMLAVLQHMHGVAAFAASSQTGSADLFWHCSTALSATCSFCEMPACSSSKLRIKQGWGQSARPLPKRLTPAFHDRMAQQCRCRPSQAGKSCRARPLTSLDRFTTRWPIRGIGR